MLTKIDVTSTDMWIRGGSTRPLSTFNRYLISMPKYRRYRYFVDFLYWSLFGLLIYFIIARKVDVDVVVDVFVDVNVDIVDV